MSFDQYTNYLQPHELSGDIFPSFDYSKDVFKKDFEFKKCHKHAKILHIVPVYLVLSFMKKKLVKQSFVCVCTTDRDFIT